MGKIMQRQICECSRISGLLKENGKRHHWSWWQETNRTFGFHTKVHTRRFVREKFRFKVESKQEYELVGCSECDGATEDLYNIGSEERRIHSGRDSEDSDIDHSQIKRWRGG